MKRPKSKNSLSKTAHKRKAAGLSPDFKKIRRYHYKILILIKKGSYAEKISRQTKTPVSTVKDRIRMLLDNGFVKVDVKSSATFYKLTKKGYEVIKAYNAGFSRYLRQKKNRLHRLNVKFPILEDNKEAKFDREHKLNNWIQKYTTLSFPIGVTIKKTSKSIIAMFHEFETDNTRTLTDFFNHVMKGTNYVYYYCMKRLDIRIDIFNGEVIDQHLVNEMPELKGKIEESKTTTLSLNRKAKSFFKTKINAKAWIDHSKGMPEIETNDFLYEEKLLAMPENMEALRKELTPAVIELRNEIRVHLEIQRETLTALKEIGKQLGKFHKK